MLSCIFAFIVHSAQLLQWILQNLKSTQLPPDSDKNSMMEPTRKKSNASKGAQVCPLPLKYFFLQFSPILSVIWSTMYCTCFPPLNVEMLLTKLQC